MREKERLKIGGEILKDYVNQFDENQNENKKLAVQVFALIGTVIAGYAYVYINIPCFVIVSYAILISEILLTAGIWYVVSSSVDFRREQFLNYKIRKVFGLAEDSYYKNYHSKILKFFRLITIPLKNLKMENRYVHDFFGCQICLMYFFSYFSFYKFSLPLPTFLKWDFGPIL